MKKEILNFIIILFTFILIMFAVPTCIRNGLLKLGCNRPNRIERQDSDYIYVWKHNKEGDSTLLRYSQPVYREFKVMGGHHKNHHIKVDWDNDGRYDCCQLPYDGSVDRCKTVDFGPSNCANVLEAANASIIYLDNKIIGTSKEVVANKKAEQLKDKITDIKIEMHSLSKQLEKLLSV